MPAHFKLEPLLRRHNKSVLALVKASGLAKTTVYNLVNNRAKAVELETLSKLIDGLERLIGKTITFDDVLEKEPRERNALLDDLLKNAKPFYWDELSKQLPDLTPEEKAEGEAFVRFLEEERQKDRLLSVEQDRNLLELFETSQESPHA